MTSDVSQGPGWWQAADLKWYPPQRHPDYVAPPPPPPRQQPSWQQPVPQAAGPPTGPPPGWYPGPTGKPGQMYWDGQRWYTAAAATTPPAAAPTPWDKVRPHVDKARPQLDKGRRFWSGLSRQRKVILALAGLLVVVAVIAVPVAAFDYLFGGPDTSSPSYQAGVQFGGTVTPQFLALRGGQDRVCQQAFKNEGEGGTHLDQQEFVAGCLAGLPHS